jgi:hypothetical protein
MANPETIKAFEDLLLNTDKIMKAQKKINPRFDLEISSSLPLAIKNKDGPKIELYLTTLKATLKDIENSLDDIPGAVKASSQHSVSTSLHSPPTPAKHPANKTAPILPATAPA